MCKFNFKNDSRRIDPCMVNLLEFIQEHSNVIEILGSCCGHGKYNMTIVVKDQDAEIFDLMSDINIPRKKQFYKKDKQGYYFIPECVEKGGVLE